MTLGNELARKIRTPEHFTDLMTNTGKNTELNRHLKDICKKVFNKYKIDDSLNIILSDFFDDNCTCFDFNKSPESHSVSFTVDGFYFEVIKYLEDIVEKAEVGANTFKNYYCKAVSLKVDGEIKLEMRYITKTESYMTGGLNKTAKEEGKLAPFDPEKDSAYLKPEGWLKAMQLFYISWMTQVKQFNKNKGMELVSHKIFKVEVDEKVLEDIDITTSKERILELSDAQSALDIQS